MPIPKSIIRALRDRDWGVRVEALNLLYRLPVTRKTARKALKMLRRDPHPKVRQQAAQFVRKLGAKGIQPLLTSLKDKHPQVRWQAVVSLQKMGLSSAEKTQLMALYPGQASIENQPDLWVALGAPGWRKVVVESKLHLLQRFLSSYLSNPKVKLKGLESQLHTLFLAESVSLSPLRRKVALDNLKLWIKSKRAKLSKWKDFPHPGVQAIIRWYQCKPKK